MVTAFSQRDPKWADLTLGTGKQSIRQAGCLLCCMASILADWGLGTTPERLNNWLTLGGGYAQSNLFVWRSVKPLGARLTALIGCATKPAPLIRAVACIANGGAVIALVDSQPGGKVQAHYVGVLGIHPDVTPVMDSWQLRGQELTSLEAHYCALGWDAARAIFALALYEKVVGQAPGPVQKRPAILV
jgi:hypothetical protein